MKTIIISILLTGLNLILVAQSGIAPPGFDPHETYDYMAQMDSYYAPLIANAGGESELALVSKGFRKYQQWKADWNPLLYPHGSKLLFDLNLFNSSLNDSPIINEESDWYELGPYTVPLQSNGTASSSHGIGPLNWVSFADDYNQSGLMFTGSWNSGMFVSTDYGNSWSIAGTDKLPGNTSTAACAVSPYDNQTWFVATGGGDGLMGYDFSGMGLSRSTGVYMTSDAGNTWERIGNDFDLGGRNFGWIYHDWYIKDVVVDKNSPITDLTLFIVTSQGIYRTDNGMGVIPEDGSTDAFNWDTTGDGLGDYIYGKDNAIVQNIDVDGTLIPIARTCANDLDYLLNTDGSQVPNEIVATVTNQYRLGDDRYYRSELLRSSDNGESWSSIPLPTGFDAEYIKLEVEILASTPNLLYISGIGIGGSDNWGDISKLLIYDIDTQQFILENQCPRHYGFCRSKAFSVNPNNPSEIIVASQTSGGAQGYVKRSLDGGQNWSSSYATSNYHADVEATAFDPLGNLWLVTHGGLSMRVAGTSDWESKSSGLGIAEVCGFGYSPLAPEHMVLGLFHDNNAWSTGIYEDGWTPTWTRTGSGDGLASYVNPLNPNHAYHSGSGSDFKYVQNQNFSSFTYISPTNQEESGWPENLEFSTVDEEILYLTEKNVWRSNNYGIDNWTKISDFDNSPQFDWILNSPNTDCIYLYPSRFYEGMLFVMLKEYYVPGTQTSTRRIFATTSANSDALTAQQSWWEIPPISEEYENHYTADILSDPDNPNVFYVLHGSAGNSQGANQDYKIAKYTYQGDLWSDSPDDIMSDPSNFLIEDLSFDFPLGISARDIEIIPGSREFFVASSHNLFYTTEELMSNGQEVWHEYGGNPPAARTFRMYLDYRNNLVRLGLVGRGIWQNDLPCWQDPDLTLTEDLTIQNFARYHQNIIVPNGITLTVNGELQMGAGTNITIEAGGDMIVNGGIVTSACDDWWHGIFVEGVPGTQSNTISGKLVMKNGATVENAITGAHNYGVESDGCTTDNSTIGGIIQTFSESKFRNNKKDVAFLHHENLTSSGQVRDQSVFFKTHFILDDEFPEDEDPWEAAVSMWSINGIRFKGCTFKDDRPELARWEMRHGILLGNSTIEVNEYCSGLYLYPGPITCNNGQATVFENLNDGIHSYGLTHPLFNTKVRNSSFKNCWNSIYLIGSDRAEIWLNDFEVTPGPAVPDLTLEMPTGIYLDNACSAYHIEGNEFYPSENSMEPDGNSTCFGIVANTMNGENNRIYRNDFKYLRLGFESIGVNRGVQTNPDANTGLKLRCNTFEGDIDDWFLTSGEDDQIPNLGIHRDQGTIPNEMADNSFKSSIHSSNILNEDTEFTNYRYNGHEDLQFQEPVLAFTVPDNLFVVPFTQEGNNTLNCPVGTVNQNGGMILQTKTLAKTDRDAHTAALLEVVDGGDTEAMQAEVESTTSMDAWQKYLLLMSEAGYLSEDVLKELAESESGFTLAMIRDVMVANPQAAKSKVVNEKLDERSTQLPEYMRDQIKLGLSQMSPKEYLQMIKDGYQFKYDIAMMDLYRHAIRDSLPGDSVIILFTELSASGNLAMDYRLVELYDATGQSNVADVLLGVMDSGDGLKGQAKVEYDRYVAYRELLETWKTQGEDLSALDAADISQLEDFAQGHDRTAVGAYALLRHNEAADERHREIYLPGHEKRLSTVKSPKEIMNGELTVFPNPAEDHITVDYRIDQAFDQASFRIIDQKGVVVLETVLKQHRDQVLLPLDLIPSSYRCEILVEGQSYQTTQLIIK